MTDTDVLADRLVELVMRDGRERTVRDVISNLRSRKIKIDEAAIRSAVVRYGKRPDVATARIGNGQFIAYRSKRKVEA